MRNRQENKIGIELKSKGDKDNILWFYYDLGEMGGRGEGIDIDDNVFTKLSKLIKKNKKLLGIEYINIKEAYDSCWEVLNYKEKYFSKWESLYYPKDWKKNVDKWYGHKPTYEKDNGNSYNNIIFKDKDDIALVSFDFAKGGLGIQVDRYILRNICDSVYYYAQQGLINSDKQYKDIIEVCSKVSSYLQSCNIIPVSNVIKIDEPDKEHNKETFNIEREISNEYYSKTKTYIMKDSHNNLYKIGKSINPRVRERTLQSEKPSIKIVKVFDKDIERKLHKDYSKHRVRGEWFELNKIQVKYICTKY